MSSLIQTIMFSISLIIVGIYVVTIPYSTQPLLFPAMGAVLIMGGVLALIAMFRN